MAKQQNLLELEEFHGVDNWESWYQSKESNSEEALFLKKINDIRVRTEKISPIATHPQISLVIPKESATPELEQELRKLQQSGDMLLVVVSELEKGMVQIRLTNCPQGKPVSS